MNIQEGKTYIYENPAPYPAEMRGAMITVEKISDGDGCSVSYDFLRPDGQSGSGSMTKELAGKYLTAYRG